jgi:hypothetical protein
MLKVEKEECIQIMMIQDKIIAAQQECEEACLQSDTPDYRMLYFRFLPEWRKCESCWS